jgi:putative transposase
MPRGLKRYQRAPLLGTEQARDAFVSAPERVRKWYDFSLIGHVVMPEHVHLLVSEPERCSLALSLCR